MQQLWTCQERVSINNNKFTISFNTHPTSEKKCLKSSVQSDDNRWRPTQSGSDIHDAVYGCVCTVPCDVTNDANNRTQSRRSTKYKSAQTETYSDRAERSVCRYIDI